MATTVLLEAFLLPHIRKYMLRKLNPATAGTSPNGLRMQLDLAAMLPLRIIECEPPEDRLRGIQRLRLTVAVPELRDLDPKTSAALNQYAEKAFLHEFCDTVDRLVHSPPYLEKQVAIEFFREQYGISEHELRFDSSRVCYFNYERRKGRELQHGGARRTSGPMPESPRYIRKRQRKKGHG